MKLLAACKKDADELKAFLATIGIEPSISQKGEGYLFEYDIVYPKGDRAFYAKVALGTDAYPLACLVCWRQDDCEVMKFMCPACRCLWMVCLECIRKLGLLAEDELAGFMENVGQHAGLYHACVVPPIIYQISELPFDYRCPKCSETDQGLPVASYSLVDGKCTQTNISEETLKQSVVKALRDRYGSFAEAKAAYEAGVLNDDPFTDEIINDALRDISLGPEKEADK